MAKKQKKQSKPKVVPRRGPPVNLRPAGVHEDKRRKALTAQDERESDELSALGQWALDEE
jgi:hypothetical protein